MEQEQIYKKVREIVSKYTKYPEIVLSGDVDDIFLTGEKIGLDLYDMVYLYNEVKETFHNRLQSCDLDNYGFATIHRIVHVLCKR